MKCANCREETAPAYTLRAHVDRDESSDSGAQRREPAKMARSDGGTRTVDLHFCSIECLDSWT